MYKITISAEMPDRCVKCIFYRVNYCGGGECIVNQDARVYEPESERPYLCPFNSAEEVY